MRAASDQRKPHEVQDPETPGECHPAGAHDRHCLSPPHLFPRHMAILAIGAGQQSEGPHIQPGQRGDPGNQRDQHQYPAGWRLGH